MKNKKILTYLSSCVLTTQVTFKTSLKSISLFVICASVFFNLSAYAESKRFSSQIKNPEKLSSDINSVFNGTKDFFNFKATLFQYGAVKFGLKKNTVVENSETKTLDGTIYGVSKKEGRKNRKEYKIAAASIYKENNLTVLKVTFSLQTRKNYTRFYEFNYTEGQNKARLVTAPQFALEGKTCGDGHKMEALSAATFETDSSLTGNFETRAATLREVDISTDTDCDAAALYGDTSNSRIAGFVNSASSIYQNDVSVRIRLTSQRNQTNCSSLSSTNSETLLTSYRALSNSNGYQNSSDGNFLFTGKDIDSNVIGLAYLGTICSAPTYAYGLVQHVNDSLNHVIFAHELGHSFGADHTNSGIMTASLGGTPPTSFNATSQNEINTYIASDNSCLATVSDTDPNPTPVPTGTPDPSGTPAPNPTATPDPGDNGDNGGNNNGGNGVYSPHLSFTGKNRASNFSGIIELENYIQGCSIILRAAASYSRAETGKLIDEIEPISENTLVKAKFTRRLKNSKNIYVAAIHSCPNRNNTVSEVVTINTSKFRTKRATSLTGVLATATFDYFGF